MPQQKCDSCGELLPPVDDAFCSYCQAAIGEDVSSRDPPDTAMDKFNSGIAGQVFRGPATPTKVYKVPRKFDLSMIFVVTAAYAAAFGLMQALNLHWGFQVGLMALLTVVGVIQMFAPDAQVRIAAVLTGVLFMLAVLVVSAVVHGIRSPDELLFGTLCMGLGVGSVIGYLSLIHI